MPLFRRVVKGLTGYDFRHNKDKKYVKAYIKENIETPLNRRQKKFVREKIIGAAKDKRGVTGREMGGIVVGMLRDKDDPVRRKEAFHIKRDLMKKGAITYAEWRHAKRKAIAEEHLHKSRGYSYGDARKTDSFGGGSHHQSFASEGRESSHESKGILHHEIPERGGGGSNRFGSIPHQRFSVTGDGGLRQFPFIQKKSPSTGPMTDPFHQQYSNRSGLGSGVRIGKPRPPMF